MIARDGVYVARGGVWDQRFTVVGDDWTNESLDAALQANDQWLARQQGRFVVVLDFPAAARRELTARTQDRHLDIGRALRRLNVPVDSLIGLRLPDAVALGWLRENPLLGGLIFCVTLTHSTTSATMVVDRHLHDLLRGDLGSMSVNSSAENISLHSQVTPLLSGSDETAWHVGVSALTRTLLSFYSGHGLLGVVRFPFQRLIISADNGQASRIARSIESRLPSGVSAVAIDAPPRKYSLRVLEHSTYDELKEWQDSYTDFVARINDSSTGSPD
jgi:hypothetical protein